MPQAKTATTLLPHSQPPSTSTSLGLPGPLPHPQPSPGQHGPGCPLKLPGIPHPTAGPCPGSAHLRGKRSGIQVGSQKARSGGVVGPLAGPWRHRKTSDPAPVVASVGEGRQSLVRNCCTPGTGRHTKGRIRAAGVSSEGLPETRPLT